MPLNMDMPSPPPRHETYGEMRERIGKPITNPPSHEDTRSTPIPPTLRENPHGWEPHVLDSLGRTSSQMYDLFYNFLWLYNFDFSPEEKEWALQQIMQDIHAANQEGDEG